MVREMQIRPVDQEALNAVEGWLTDAARTITQFLFALQRENGWITGVLELGVFKGKYLSLLAQQVAGSDVPVVGVDAFLQRHGLRLSSDHKALAEQTILNSIRTVAGSTDNLTLLAGYTTEVSVADLLELCPPGFSFISVDAGHDAEDVEHDTAMADKLLHDHGVVAFDDIYNAACPGVAEGFMRYMTSGDRALAPFATGGNKVFACRPSAHSRYYEFSKDVARTIPDAPQGMARTLNQLNANEQNEWSPKLIGYDIIPFL